MATYLYKVKDDMGRNLFGVIDASNEREVKKKLRQPRLFFIWAKKYNKKKFYGKRVPFKTLIMFTQRFATLMDAGVPVLSAMNILWRQSEDQTIQLAVSEMKTRLEEGSQISSAMEAFPNIFPLVYTALIRVGEKGGALVTVLSRLSEYLEYKAAIIDKSKRAVMYPLIVLVFSVIVVLSMFIFVVPIFQKVLMRLDVELPIITKIVLVFSEMLRSGIFWLVAFVGGLVFYYIVKLVKRSPKACYMIDGLYLRIPYFGDILMAISLSQLIRSLTILLGAGVPVMESLEVANSTCGNKKITEDIAAVKKDVEQGASLYEGFRKIKIFPMMLNEMIGIGESSGMMVPILEKVTKHFDDEVDYEINKFLTFLEPALIIMVGGIVILTLLSIYLPIISIWKGIMA